MIPPSEAQPGVTIDWKSALASHHEQLWFAPGPQRADTGQLTVCELGDLLPPYDPGALVPLSTKDLCECFAARAHRPHVGRFYPANWFSAVLAQAGESRGLVRLVQTAEGWSLEANHPLRSTALTGTISARSLGEPASRFLASSVSSGPGMQAPWQQTASDFYHDYPFPRGDEADDELFYNQPRLVQHIDAMAIEQTRALYARVLPNKGQVLDLMSSWVSHLPEDRDDLEVTGLGMNETELAANPALGEFIIQDLNRTPALAMGSACFDAAVCTVSIEYLREPLAVFTEIARVLKPGGVFVNVLSERCFPTKTISLWQLLHPFERLGLVLDFYRRTPDFERLNTFSTRGLRDPRSANRTDPVYAVWGYKTNVLASTDRGAVFDREGRLQ